MKTIYGLLAALIISATAMAQPTPQEKNVLRRDLAKERNKRHEVARDVLRGEPGKAKADHRAAVAYHRKIHQDARQIHNNDAQRAEYRRARQHSYARRHHYRH
jgi:hypothetical protein